MCKVNRIKHLALCWHFVGCMIPRHRKYILYTFIPDIIGIDWDMSDRIVFSITAHNFIYWYTSHIYHCPNWLSLHSKIISINTGNCLKTCFVIRTLYHDCFYNLNNSCSCDGQWDSIIYQAFNLVKTHIVSILHSLCISIYFKILMNCLPEKYVWTWSWAKMLIHMLPS